MSKFLDELARALAKPMPRSRAVRVLGVALASAAVPSLRPEPAAARHERPVTTSCHTAKCTHAPFTKLCKCHEKPTGSPNEPTMCNWTCCDPERYECICPPGEASCKCAKPCKGDCCKRSQACTGGGCQDCEDLVKGSNWTTCGRTCCFTKTKYCASPALGLCCGKDQDPSVAFDPIAKAGVGRCCPKGHSCAYVSPDGETRRATCCPPGKCRKGRCA